MRVQGDLESAALGRVMQRGFPNYFGPQRFGHAGRNLAVAQTWLLQGRRERGNRTRAPERALYLSVLRSFLFNEQLALRGAAGQLGADHSR